MFDEVFYTILKSKITTFMSRGEDMRHGDNGFNSLLHTCQYYHWNTKNKKNKKTTSDCPIRYFTPF